MSTRNYFCARNLLLPPALCPCASHTVHAHHLHHCLQTWFTYTSSVPRKGQNLSKLLQNACLRINKCTIKYEQNMCLFGIRKSLCVFSYSVHRHWVSILGFQHHLDLKPLVWYNKNSTFLISYHLFSHSIWLKY